MIASGLSTLHRPTYAKMISTFSQAKKKIRIMSQEQNFIFMYVPHSELCAKCIHSSTGKLLLQFLLFTHGLGEVLAFQNL